MIAYLRYLSERFVIFVATIFISITIVFFVPRLVPGHPLTAVFSRMAAAGGRVNAPQLIEEYNRLFGLDKSLWEQYVSFLRELARGNLGYSIGSFPSRVSDMLRSAVPWTIGLLALTTLISWVLGSLIRAVAGWRGGKSRFFQALVPAALVLYSIPYYILAIILIFLFAGTLPRLCPGCAPPCHAAGLEHHSCFPGLVVPLHAEPDHLLEGRGLHPTG